MKYHYFYQTAQNEKRDGWVTARDRHDAYDRLHAKGIKPYKMIGDNPIAWKRWTAIVVLVIVSACLSVALMRSRSESVVGVRAQLYGDPAIIQRMSSDGWRAAFPDETDAWLARHAIPGRKCSCEVPDSRLDAVSLAEGCERLCVIRPDDPNELKSIKRMVNGLKLECRDYLAAGGSEEDYRALCCERNRTERNIYDSVCEEITRIVRLQGADMHEEFDSRNRTLRSLGLPTVPFPEDKESEARLSRFF